MPVCRATAQTCPGAVRWAGVRWFPPPGRPSLHSQGREPLVLVLVPN